MIKYEGLLDFVRRYKVFDVFIIILAIGSLILGYITYSSFAKALPYHASSSQLVLLLNFDLAAVLLLGMCLAI